MASEYTETPQPTEGVTAQSRYGLLETMRRPYLERARKYAALTIPGLLPPEGSTGASDLPEPYQSVGADCVNNLAAKLLLTLFPPGSAFFRLDADEKILEEAAQQDPKGPDEINQALREIEKRVLKHMEQKGCRTVNYEALSHLIVTGNGLVQIQDDGAEKFFPLDRYVVKRDLNDNVLEIITKECLAKSALPAKIREFINALPEKPKEDNQKTVEVYTWVKRTDSGSWTVEQQVCGQTIPGSEGTYPKDKSAWLPLRWRRVHGEDYGRGHCEEHGGTLLSLETHEATLNAFSAAAGKILLLVDESGVTSAEKIANAPSGAAIEGREADLSWLAFGEKMADYTIVKATRDDLKTDLRRAFLHTSSVQRDAERVTAEEIRAMIAELESGLGGIYSMQAESYQRPLIVRIINQLQKAGKLPHLPDGAVSPQIVTGVEGLGRTSDAQKLDQFLAGLSELFGPEALAANINVDVYLKRRAIALGVEDNGLVKSPEQIQSEQQAKMQQEMTGKLGPSIIGAGVEGAKMASEQKPQQTQTQ